jgi:hypothetical protein
MKKKELLLRIEGLERDLNDLLDRFNKLMEQVSQHENILLDIDQDKCVKHDLMPF